MNKSNPLKRILNTRGMGGALTAFAGLIVIYIAFGIINPTVFSGQNIMNLLRSMSKYLLIGIGQSYILITGNIDLSIGSVAGMSAMVSATLMTMGVHPIAAILVTLVCCLAIGVLNGLLVGKWKLPPSSPRWAPCSWPGAWPTSSTATATPTPSPPALARRRLTPSGISLLRLHPGHLQHLLDRHRPVRRVLLPAVRNPDGPPYLRHRLQCGRGQAVRGQRASHHHQGLSGQRLLLLRGGPDPVRPGRHGKYGGRQHV